MYAKSVHIDTQLGSDWLLIVQKKKERKNERKKQRNKESKNKKKDRNTLKLYKASSYGHKQLPEHGES